MFKKVNKRLFRNQQHFAGDTPLSIEFQKDPDGFIRERFTETETHAFKQLCYLKQRYNIFKMSQSWLAKKLGVSRQYVNEILSKFESLGIIKMWYHHKGVSHYKLSSFFTNHMIALLSYLWRAIPLSLLVSYTASDATIEKSRQFINNVNKNNNNNINNKTLYSKEGQQIDNELAQKINNIINKHQKNNKQEKITIRTDLVKNNSINLNEKAIQDLKKSTININNKTINNKGIGSMEVGLYEKYVLSWVDEIKSIRPTIWGQVMLSAYPKEVVLLADKAVLRCKKPLETNMDKWKYLLSVCKIHSEQNKIQTSWPMAFEIGKELGMPNSGPFVDPLFVADPIKELPEKPKIQRNTEKIYQNEQAMKQLGLDGCKRQKRKHQEEWEWTRINNPEKFARWEESAKQFRAILGLHEDGTFQVGRSPQQAVDILMNMFAE